MCGDLYMIYSVKKWVKYLFFSYHSFAMYYDSKKGAVFYASFMIALNLILLIINGFFLLKISLGAFPFENNINSWHLSIGSLILATIIFILFRTGERYDKVLRDVKILLDKKKKENRIKTVSIILPSLLLICGSILAFLLRT